jgi:hypothetical protein
MMMTMIIIMIMDPTGAVNTTDCAAQREAGLKTGGGGTKSQALPHLLFLI